MLVFFLLKLIDSSHRFYLTLFQRISAHTLSRTNDQVCDPSECCHQVFLGCINVQSHLAAFPSGTVKLQKVVIVFPTRFTDAFSLPQPVSTRPGIVDYPKVQLTTQTRKKRSGDLLAIKPREKEHKNDQPVVALVALPIVPCNHESNSGNTVSNSFQSVCHFRSCHGAERLWRKCWLPQRETSELSREHRS